MSTLVSACGLAPRPVLIASAINLIGKCGMVGAPVAMLPIYIIYMWPIFGIHDQRWREKVRDVFRNTRYMNCEGSKKKLDVAAFVNRYGGE